MEDKITIPIEEYKELLIIKGKYEELKDKNRTIIYKDLGIDKNTNIPTIPAETYKITC